MPASSPPAPPSKWPVMDLVELMGRKRRHRHPRLELCAVLLPLFAHFALSKNREPPHEFSWGSWVIIQPNTLETSQIFYSFWWHPYPRLVGVPWLIAGSLGLGGVVVFPGHKYVGHPAALCRWRLHNAIVVPLEAEDSGAPSRPKTSQWQRMRCGCSGLPTAGSASKIMARASTGISSGPVSSAWPTRSGRADLIAAHSAAPHHQHHADRRPTGDGAARCHRARTFERQPGRNCRGRPARGIRGGDRRWRSPPRRSPKGIRPGRAGSCNW